MGTTRDDESHPFYERLNQILAKADFDAYETGLRARGSLTVWLGLTDGKLANWELAEADAQDARPTTQVLEPRHRDDGHLGLGVWPGVQAD